MLTRVLTQTCPWSGTRAWHLGKALGTRIDSNMLIPKIIIIFDQWMPSYLPIAKFPYVKFHSETPRTRLGTSLVREKNFSQKLLRSLKFSFFFCLAWVRMRQTRWASQSVFGQNCSPVATCHLMFSPRHPFTRMGG